MSDDLYEILGVSRQATQDEIKKAYRRLARQHHPDANSGDSEAEARFKEIAMAYEVLSDAERRAQYDRFGAAGQSPFGGDPFGGGGGLGDIFDAFFGGNSPFGGGGGRVRNAGPPPGSDVEVRLDLSFEQAVFGAQVDVSVRTQLACADCGGTGAVAGTEPTTCPDCSGSGQMQTVRQTILGQVVTAVPCRRCDQTGQIVTDPCRTCAGAGRVTGDATYTVDVPAGVDTGNTLRLSGKGAVGPRGGPTGDLYVRLRVAQHDRFVRQGVDLVHDLPVSISQAALGHHFDYETLDGAEELVIPRGTQNGRVFRLRGRGVPHLEGRSRGDLLVRVNVVTPTELSTEEEQLLARLAEIRGESVVPPDDGFLSKIRSAFR